MNDGGINQNKQFANNISGPIFESGPGWGERLGNWFRKNGNNLLAVAAVLVLAWGVIAILGGNSDKISLENNTSADSEAIVEIAQPKDGYVILARRALAGFLGQNTEELTAGQKLFAEEYLRQVVEKDALEIGQEVRFLVSDIKNAIEQAYGLTSAQLQKWEAWAETVNFNK